MENSASRRRSQRLFIQIPVVIKGQLAGKSPFCETTHTVVVNAHGALVESPTAPQQGQTLVMRNARTNEEAECRVKMVTPTETGKFNLALEFNAPNPGFWRVSFPPDDWSVRHPDAKKSR